MIKKIINYIFIYILLVICTGCDENIFGTDEICSECVLELNIPELDVDENGYYHLEFDENSIQTFTRIEAYVGVGMVYLGWMSDTQYCVDMWNHTSCHDVVNPASYSGSDGYAYQMVGVHQEHVGDTITVYCGYYDNYDVQHLNQLRIIINE
jgi:hypothetical protein